MVGNAHLIRSKDFNTLGIKPGLRHRKSSGAEWCAAVGGAYRQSPPTSGVFDGLEDEVQGLAGLEDFACERVPGSALARPVVAVILAGI
jgi:hypothetical protein